MTESARGVGPDRFLHVRQCLVEPLEPSQGAGTEDQRVNVVGILFEYFLGPGLSIFEPSHEDQHARRPGLRRNVVWQCIRGADVLGKRSGEIAPFGVRVGKLGPRLAKSGILLDRVSGTERSPRTVCLESPERRRS